MGMACSGITHCEKCGFPLDMNEYGKCKSCREKEREELQKQNVRFTDDNFEEHFQKFLDTYTPDELLNELVECGLELTPEESKKWIEPIVIDTVEDAEIFIRACEKAAAAQLKHLNITYKDITDIDEIKKIFNNIKSKRVECWETLCLNNSACDAFEETSNENPYCLKQMEDCPNKIDIDF